MLFKSRLVRRRVGHLLPRLLIVPPLRSPILDEPIIPLKGSERRPRKGANLVHEVLGVLLRKEVGDEPDRGGRTEVELRGDGDEVGGQEGDVDCGKDLELQGTCAKGQRRILSSTCREFQVVSELMTPE